MPKERDLMAEGLEVQRSRFSSLASSGSRRRRRRRSPQSGAGEGAASELQERPPGSFTVGGALAGSPMLDQGRKYLES